MKLLTLVVAAALLAGCASSTGTPAPAASGACGSAAPAPTSAPCAAAPDVSPSPSVASSPSPAVSPTPFAGTPTTVRLALDWTPNTDHTGFFVAKHEGWYRDAGIDLQVLPYATATPETLMAAHQADGGTGDFTVATLDAAAYEALYQKRADFTIPFTAWEGVEATQRGIALRYFQFHDYGFPEFYQVVLACDRQWLTKDPDAAKRFVAASVRGFQLSNDQPDEAAAMLVAENPGAFDANPALPKASQEFLAQGGYLVDGTGKAGPQTLQRWTDYSKFLYDQKLLADRNGKPLTAPPDYAALFTNDFLP
jgi:ABC-type nitrate/sulfonate/bicarbonate transport system substrate-binding protein